ncbi:MAG: transporter [Modestobacter sp.]|nr:transporter [Modestobacter sp.]MCW2617180.1 transporter [Modestobacter sp.]
MSATLPPRPRRSSVATPTDGWKPNRITVKDTRFATGIAFLAWVFAVYDFILFGTLLPEISATYGWSTSTATAIATWVSVGTFVVALLLGPVVDRIGRRRGMMVTLAGTAIASGATAATMNPGYLVGVRSVAGLGYSEQAINAAYLNEIYDVTEDEAIKRHRGFVYSLVQGGWPIGVLLAALLTSIFLPVVGWRGCFLIAVFPAVVIVILRRKMKESPQFQVQHRARRLRQEGHTEEAGALLVEHGLAAEAPQAPFRAIFSRGYARNTVFLAIAFFLNWFGTQTFSVLGTTVLTEGKDVTFNNALIILILSNAVGFAGYVFHGWVGDRLGRRNTIAVGWVLGGIAFALMCTVAEGTVAVVTLFSLGLFFQIGPYSALLFFMADCFSTGSRATGTTFINSLGQIGAVVAGVIITRMLTAGADITTAALVVGAVGTLVSGLVMFGCTKEGAGLREAQVRAAAR